METVYHGYTAERVVSAYPTLTKSDVEAALEYAEEIVGREHIVDLIE